jgi:delta24(24(1))-sterol reductase
MIWGVVLTIITYVVALTLDQTHRMTGSIPYDMFMGVILNPRLGNVDLKMWSEIRIPWKILFFISLSAAVKDHEINIERDLLAGITPEVWSFAGGLIQMYKIQTSSTLLFMLLAHFLYANACMKGEVSSTIKSVSNNTQSAITHVISLTLLLRSVFQQRGTYSTSSGATCW